MTGPRLYPVSHEIDLRDELRRMFVGDAWEIGKEQLYIYRRMRRGEDDRLVPCSCNNPLSQEGDRHIFCPYCFGEGFLWDEHWISGIRVRSRGARRRVDRLDMEEAGLLHPEISYMYVNHLSSPTTQDKILAPQIDPEGRIQWPVKVSHYWAIEKADPLRGDGGRIEYWLLTLRERPVDD